MDELSKLESVDCIGACFPVIDGRVS